MIDVRLMVTDAGVGRYALTPSAVVGVAVHHSVSGGQFFTGAELTKADELNHIKVIDQYHKWRWGAAFGYHLAAFPSGRCYYVGDLAGARTHVAGRNNELIGIVLIGDFESERPPDLQIVAAAEGVSFIRQTYPGRVLKGHREWAIPGWETSCPGDVWRSWIDELDSYDPEEDALFTDEDRERAKRIEGMLNRILGPQNDWELEQQVMMAQAVASGDTDALEDMRKRFSNAFLEQNEQLHGQMYHPIHGAS